MLPVGACSFRVTAVVINQSSAAHHALIGALGAARMPLQAGIGAEPASAVCAVKRAGAVAPAAQFPHLLLDEAERVFKSALQATAQPSKLQQEVSARLWDLGIQHSSQHLTGDGLFCVDIALHDSQVRPPCPSECPSASGSLG